MSPITVESLHRALAVLGELMELRAHPARHFVVCGGSSLLALGLVRRTVTQDVDILGQIHAAVDRDGGRLLQDLLDLAPTAEELLTAARWARTQDPSEGFGFNLGKMLAHLGHGNLADQL